MEKEKKKKEKENIKIYEKGLRVDEELANQKMFGKQVKMPFFKIPVIKAKKKKKKKIEIMIYIQHKI